MDLKPDRMGRAVSVLDCRPEADLQGEAIGLASYRGEELMAFADAMPVLIAYVGADRRFRFTNKTCDAWLGRPRGWISGRSVREVLGPAMSAAIDRHVEAALAGANVAFEMVIPFDDHRTLRMTFMADTNEGAVRGFFVLGEDLSEKSRLLHKEIANRERMRIALAEKERLLSELVETAPSLVVLADPEGRILLFNRACEELTGYARKEVIGKNLIELFVPPEWQPAVQQRFADPHAPEVRQPHENAWLTKAGEQRSIEWRCAALPMEGDDRLGVLGIGVDITARKVAERAACEQQIELARVLRINTMGEMVAALAHELSQPLAAILSYTQGCQRLMAGHEGCPPDVDTYLGKLAGQAQRAGEIIHHIRRFIQKDEPLRENYHVNELVREVAMFARAEAAAHGIQFTLNLAPRPLPVWAERIAVEQVIVNLFHNGIEALAGAGAGHPHREISIGTRMGKDVAVVAIKDTGPGVAPKVRESLFRPFVTTKRNGLGLGLSICRSIVRDHGGKMWLAEAGGTGATFCFTLPLAGRAIRPDG
jgi:two-component system sensor kinase FixL